MKLPHTHEVVVHYAWLDENGEKMSPEHKTLGSAISFAADWHENYARVKRAVEKLWDEVANHEEGEDAWHEREAERIKKRALKGDDSLLRMSATGKAPYAIVRMVITTTFEEPPSSESTTAQVVLEASELSARTAA